MTILIDNLELRRLYSYDDITLTGAFVSFLAVIAFLLSFGYLKNSKERECVPYSVDIPLESLVEWKGEILDSPTIKVSSFELIVLTVETLQKDEIQCYNPANGMLLKTLKAHSLEDIDLRIENAGVARQQWRKTTFAQRRQVLRSMLKFVLENQETIARIACIDSGKTMLDAALGEILTIVEKLNWTIKHGEAALKPERRPTSMIMIYKHAEVWYEPLGIISAFVSWNYPFHNVFAPIITAIFAGNAVIIKGSEQTAWSSRFFTNIAKKALEACGHSSEIVQNVIALPEQASYLLMHPSIRHVTFIGSHEVGIKVAKQAAEILRPVTIELGGKDAAIILEEVHDINAVTATLMRGTFQSAGQNCVGIERIICVGKIYNQVIDLVDPLVKNLRVGYTLDEEVDMGAMINDRTFDHLEELINEAVMQGARLVYGGLRFHHPKYTKGHYFMPTLLVDVTTSMRIANEEVFAPVMTFMKASTLDEAIEITNSSKYGLGGSVFGKNNMHVEHVISSVETGMMSANDFACYYLAQLPFGGTKGSGYGRFGGNEGLRAVSNLKSVCTDITNLVQTRIPSVVQYPIRDQDKAWCFLQGLLEVLYATNLRQRAQGLMSLARNSV
ncbi:putative aldehyde dehydrogenase-like protein [Neolecta irregularis DAH-3]|uniref:Putative aldehyde dehydrogenase-like protein n=1 Tax=Neolecta irregularis (strain DAH-3) TaxID=1198029 RepID=A0A1U7LQF6_NEOID|nr:putative aldehyde dehydrogenase-like protein [Neolecta irregularis DAH-3]|eukprot:OLL24895.1 putative aldehyde dehydrogenase-like protein [Neolecta irregularis DAH-3]